MRSAKKSRTTRRNTLTLLAIAIAATIIVISAVRNQTGGQNGQKPLASEYLKVEHTRSLGEFYNSNKTVVIRVLGLNITAIGGDATNIMITGLPTQGEEYPYISSLKQGESKNLAIQLKGYSTGLEEEGYPVELTIGCDEAAPIEITIYLKPEDITGSHY